MKTKMIYTMALAGLVILAFTACTGPFLPETGSGETIPQGMGLVRISLGGGEERTVLPDAGGSYYFTLDFTAPGKTAVRVLDNGTTLTVPLEPADWTLEVTGYADASRQVPVVRGSAACTVTAGAETACTVNLTRDFHSGGKGSLAYHIDLSELPGSTRGMFGLYPLDTSGTSREIDISASAGGSASDTLMDLPEGAYLAVVDLYNSADNTAAVWTGAVHIDNGSVTTLDRSFSAGDFAEGDPVVTTETNTLVDKLYAALTSPSGSYTISLDGTETDLTRFHCQPFNVTGNKDIAITLRGNGNEVQQENSSGSLFTVKAESGSSLTLVLQDIILTGQSNNNASLVRVESRGTLEMKAGSRVTGSTANLSYGGGVYVDFNGTFIMSGGEVSGNRSSYGGGVYVGSGTFIMSGGAVSGNTAITSSSVPDMGGGGVYINSNGTFIMSGGAVSGNTAVHSLYGGGVYVSGGTFTMSGGKVSGNTAVSSFSFGGGVYVDSGTFTMSGGEVSGNTSSSSSSSYSSYGGGVYVGSGTFTMNGGKVSGNAAAASTSSAQPSYGGGVYVGSGTFTMNGGEVSGNTSSAFHSSSGGGVYVGSGTFTMNGGEVSGNTSSSSSSITSSAQPSSGSGVYVGSGTFTMNGGKVSGNTVVSSSSSSGGGVYVDSGTFTMSNGEVSDNTASSSSYFSYGGGVYVSNNGTFTMSNGEVSGNTASSSSAHYYSYGGGVYVSNNGTFAMSNGEVNCNTASSSSSYGGGVYVDGGTFTMSNGEVRGNTASSSSSSYSSYGGGVYVGTNGTFTMSNGEMSGNIAVSSASSYGGGVYVDRSGTLTMSGGGVNGNILSTVEGGFGMEVMVMGTFNISGDARPQRVFLYNNTRYITISGPLSGGVVPVDLGISGDPLATWKGRPVLVLDSSYGSGNLASLKEHFTLGNATLIALPYTETAVPAEYTIDDAGKLPPPPPSSGIGSITYNTGTWTPDAGRYKSPVISHNTTTKARVNFTSTAADAVIVVQLEVSSANNDYAFISTLDNGSASYDSGYYPGSRISGMESVTISIPVPAAGSHFIDILYRKDGGGIGGLDCAWFTLIE